MDARLLDLTVLDRFRGSLPPDVYLLGRGRRYPARLNRYLIASSYLIDEALLRGEPLRVCEIGISRGILPGFLHEATAHCGLDHADVVQSWEGVDLDVSRAIRPELYDRLIVRDVEQSVGEERYDAYILMHVLEHLFDPLAVLTKLRERAADRALFIIGVPSHPELVHWLHESWIRQHTNSNGHVSSLSRRRLRQHLQRIGLSIEEEQAAYVLRASGYACEDVAWFQRWNLALGRWFPSFPGEYFACARKAA
jgi:hypothetical protein